MELRHKTPRLLISLRVKKKNNCMYWQEFGKYDKTLNIELCIDAKNNFLQLKTRFYMYIH